MYKLEYTYRNKDMFLGWGFYISYFIALLTNITWVALFVNQKLEASFFILAAQWLLVYGAGLFTHTIFFCINTQKTHTKNTKNESVFFCVCFFFIFKKKVSQ